MRGRFLIGLAASLLTLLPAPAEATFPGSNGMVVFSSRSNYDQPSYDLHMAFGDGELERTVAVTPAVSELRPAWSPDGETIAYDAMVSGQHDVYTTRFDGTDTRQLTTNPADDGDAAWSPDGQRIAFTSSRSGAFALCQINAAGTGESCMSDSFGHPLQGRAPNWAPDGQKIAFENAGAIWTVHVDGTALTRITFGSNPQGHPNWSPDGQKIAYDEKTSITFMRIKLVNPDGTNPVTLTAQNLNDPSWSPDGTKFALINGSGGEDRIYSLHSDGTGPFVGVSDSIYTNTPDWGTFQPAIVGYPHPRGATPMRLPLVPAFEECLEPNGAHGAPLSFPSCDPPLQASSSVTFGNDAEGVAARFTGSLSMKVVPDDPGTGPDEADVRLESRLTDVRCRVALSSCTGGALSDYTGTLHGQILNLRITDHEGYPSTIPDRFILPFSIPCSETVDPTIGSLCSVTTTADTLLPGLATGGLRTIWQIGGFQVLDGTLDDQVLAVAGLFAP